MKSKTIVIIKTSILICFLFISVISNSQSLILTGTISVLGTDSLTLRFPDEYGIIRRVAVEDEGSFNVVIPSKQPRFAYLEFTGVNNDHIKIHYSECILLSPGRPLHVDMYTPKLQRSAALDASLKVMSYGDYYSHFFLLFSGKAKPENELTEKLIEGKDTSDASQDVLDRDGLKGQTYYTSWSIDSLKRILLPILINRLAQNREIVQAAHVPFATQQAILTELKYEYASNLLSVLPQWIDFRRKDIHGNYCFPLQDTVISIFGQPSPAELKIGSSKTYDYLASYTSYRNLRINYELKNDPDTVHAHAYLSKIMHGEPYAKFSALREETKAYDGGHDYFDYEILVDKYVLSRMAYEKELTQGLKAVCTNVKQPALAEVFLEALEENFPKSPDLPALRQKVEELKLAKAKYANSPDIKILYYQNPSLKELIAPYAGKVVYLDLWGTWCGPCRGQMLSEPALKEHFKGDSNVVFLFIDKDEDGDEQRWKDFIATSHLTGDHIRLNASQIQKVIDDLEGISGYPTYCIFNRQGNLVVKDAKKPSDGNVLYAQLNEILNK